MDFDFTDEQEQLRDAVRRWVDKGYPFERRRAAVAAGGFSRDAWREMADLGLTGLAVAEAAGGLGLGAVDAMLVMQELGRGIVLEPYVQGALVAPALLAGSDAGAAWLPRIAAGDALVALAHQEHAARYRLAHVTTQVQARAPGLVLTGRKSVVAAGDLAQGLIVTARAHGAADDATGIGLYLVERGAPGLVTRGHALQDGSRAAEVSFADTPAVCIAEPGHAFARLLYAVDIALAAHMAEAVGAMDQLFAITVDYLNTRRQFGVPIGTFQALRHRVADMKMQLELARSMSYYATLRLGDAEAVRRRAVSQARVQLGQSMRFVGQQAVQLHGGIACTDEYVASHYFKRLTCLEMGFGDTLHHLGEVAARLGEPAGVFA